MRSHELEEFDDARAAQSGVNLAASLDGRAATPLHNFVQGLVGAKLRKRLGEAAPAAVCIRHRAAPEAPELTYGLELLHHAPEVLAAAGSAGRLAALPLSFPWDRSEEGAADPEQLEPLRLLLRAEALYHGSQASEGEAAEAALAALALLERAAELQPGNLAVELRRAAVLGRLGRRAAAVKCLVALQSCCPRAARLYWRVGTLLAAEEATARTALVTIHGSLRWGVAGSRLYFPRLLSLARRCVLLLWGSAALGGAAGFLPNGVLQMVLDKVRTAGRQSVFSSRFLLFPLLCSCQCGTCCECPACASPGQPLRPRTRIGGSGWRATGPRRQWRRGRRLGRGREASRKRTVAS